MKTIKLSLLLLLISVVADAQRFSVSTNALEYANFGTINAELSYAPDQRWSINVGAKYNPFTFREGEAEAQFQNRQRTICFGARYWPWHVYSDWWIGLKAQAQEYNVGGILSPRTEEGDRYGVGLSAGYTLLIHKSLNLDFGLGLWGGMKIYSVYACPKCGVVESEGAKGFVMPNDVIISLVYVF